MPLDVIVIETDRGSYTGFESVEVSLDIEQPCSATLEFGDDGSASSLFEKLRPGTEVKVYLNDLLRLSGRTEVTDADLTVESGARIVLSVVTKLADARETSIDHRIKVTDTTLKDFVLAAYAPLGYGPGDFEFAPAAARNLLTGKAGAVPAPAQLEAIQVDKLKLQPGEMLYEAVETRLKRHNLTHWDAPNGKIVVGCPDEDQDPTYELTIKRSEKRGAGARIKRTQDWSKVPAEVWVYGGSMGRDLSRSAFKGVAVDLDLAAEFARSGNFNRRVVMNEDGVKNQEQAEAKARRAMAERLKRKDGFIVETDGWTWRGVPWSTNTTIDMFVDYFGGALGKRLITRVKNSMNVENGPKTHFECAGPGVWKL